MTLTAAADQALDVLWSEADLLAYATRTARLLGWLVYHTRYSIRSEPGLPDLLLVKAPRIVFAELKSRRGALSRSRFGRGPRPRWVVGQDEWLRALAGCDNLEVYVWRPSDIEDIATILTTGPAAAMRCRAEVLALAEDAGPAQAERR